MKKILNVFLLLTIISCNNRKNNVFIENFGNQSFDKYKNWNIIKPDIPGFGPLAPTYFVERNNNPLHIRYVVELNEKKNGIKKISKVVIGNNKVTDGEINNKQEIGELVLQFITFNIYSIKVDENGNIYILQDFDDNKEIARFKSLKYVEKNKWKLLKDNWYEEK